MTLLRIGLLVLLACATATQMAAGRLGKRWQLNLDKLIKEPAGLPSDPSHTVFAVSFSPSGSQIGVIADLHQLERKVRSHLLIVDLDSPRSSVRQFELEEQFPVEKNGVVRERRRDSLRWNGDSPS